MQKDMEQLRALMAEIADLQSAGGLLGWDQQVNMPPGGTETRGYQLGILGRIAHERATAPELGKLLERLRAGASSLDPDSDDARLVKVASRDFDKAVRVPASFVEERARVTTAAFQAWHEARQESRFERFRPHLERIVDLLRRYVSFFPPADHPYDVLLDDYEPGMKAAEVSAIFEPLRSRQVALIRKIAAAGQVDDAFLHQPFDENVQWTFGVEVITKFGYDWKRGRQDKSPHPFTAGFSTGDVRITTRVDPQFLGTALFGTMHECGHALYGQGHAAQLERTPLCEGASLAVHESQSRLWENLVGRSRPFWLAFYPRLQELFPQLRGTPRESFYRGINRVRPSLIRVEADEATYNLHIMLRMELEIGLITGRVSVKELPERWNAGMTEYLGVTPSDDAHGVLQDVHWSGASMGYFPTYALGNLVSTQLWEAIRRDIPDLEEQVGKARFEGLLSWLRERIHRHGRKFEPQELVRRVKGSGIEAGPYVRYLERKYGEIYGF
jgi:carboxypeptidase Taq